MPNKKFLELTPYAHVNQNIYRDAINYAFKSDTIHNIAISGSYGSGKSSVWNSFETVNQDKGYLHVSLTHFSLSNPQTNSSMEQAGEDDANLDNKCGGDIDITAENLEGKILNQLLQQIEPSKIPDSRFKVKHSFSVKKAIGYLLLWIILLISLSCVFKNGLWKTVLGVMSPEISKFFKSGLWYRIAAVISVGVVLFLGYTIARYFYSRQFFKKFDINGIGFEVFHKDEDSFFDRYLDEIIYILENAGARALVIEDIDRFDSTLIFEKLREINDILWMRYRLRKDKKKDGPIPPKFFYLLRDDILPGTERSKFFDFIVPVVPIADVSNSGDVLVRELEAVGLQGEISERFLERVSLYLSDMRLLKNIVNEYRIYRECIDGKHNDFYDSQLALIIYKNIFPQDFTQMQQGRGYVYTILSSANHSKIVSRISEESLKPKIAELTERIVKAEAEQLESLDELNALFIDCPWPITSVGDHNIEGMSHVAIIRLAIEKCEFVQVVDSYGRAIDFTNYIKRMEANEEYQRRREYIEDKTQLDLLNNQLAHHKNMQAKLEAKSFKELCDDYGDELTFELPLDNDKTDIEKQAIRKVRESSDFPLLKFLLREGYIREDYAAYTSRYYGSFLTPHDRDFLLSISNRKALPWDYKLDSTAKVLEKLEEVDFNHKEVQNYDLMEFILSERKPVIEKWLYLVNQDFKESGRANAFDFFIAFWRSKREQKRFISALAKYASEWPKIWMSHVFLPPGEAMQLQYDFLTICSEEELNFLNKEDWLRNSVAASDEFMRILQPKGENASKLVRALSFLDVKFEEFHFENYSNILEDGLYEENLYVLNRSTLSYWMKKKWHVDQNEIDSHSYTLLLSHPEEPLTVRIESELEGYMAILLATVGVQFDDSEFAVSRLLNHESIPVEYKVKYIGRLNSKLSHLEDIRDDTLWPQLILRDCVDYSVGNMDTYYQRYCMKGFDEALIHYINQDYHTYFSEEYRSQTRLNEKEWDSFTERFLKSSEIVTARYEQCTSVLQRKYSEFKVSGIPPERMSILLKNKVLGMTGANVRFVQDYYRDLYPLLVASAQDKYLDLVRESSVAFDDEIIKDLLCSNNLREDYKVKLLRTWQRKIRIDAFFSSMVKATIIREYMYPDDLVELIKQYPSHDDAVKLALMEKAAQDPELIIEFSKKAGVVPEELYAVLLESNNEAALVQLRKLLTNKSFEEVCTTNSRPTFARTDANRKILEYFQVKGWISSYTDDGIVLRAYPKKKNV